MQRDILLLKPRHYKCTNIRGTHEDERTVLFKTISLDGIKSNTNPKTNPNPNTKPKPKLTLILTLFSCFLLFFRAPYSDLQSSQHNDYRNTIHFGPQSLRS